MVFLPKKATSSGIVNHTTDQPPWRPLIIMAAFISRVYAVLRRHVGRRIPNEAQQFVFQSHKAVEHLATLIAMLIEHAKAKNENIIMLSKDCLKCFDRIPPWEYIYIELGVP